MGEIRIVGPGKTRGYPYPVCKKHVYLTYSLISKNISSMNTFPSFLYISIPAISKYYSLKDNTIYLEILVV